MAEIRKKAAGKEKRAQSAAFGQNDLKLIAARRKTGPNGTGAGKWNSIAPAHRADLDRSAIGAAQMDSFFQPRIWKCSWNEI